MDSDEFESQMRAFEYFHALKMLPGTWPVIRVDGKGFSKFTEARFEKPFDERFSQLPGRMLTLINPKVVGVVQPHVQGSW